MELKTMRVKYYMINLLFGVVGVLALGTGWYENPGDPKNQLWMIYTVVSWLAFPFAKFAVESIALKFTEEGFWHRGFFKDDIGKNGLVAIYWVFCFFFAIPLSLISIPFLKKG